MIVRGFSEDFFILDSHSRMLAAQVAPLIVTSLDALTFRIACRVVRAFILKVLMVAISIDCLCYSPTRWG